ncbi:MAG: HepT-like ribonuclease domain-containing protein [Bacteroidota bacterium]|nr:HepT-like ribonuclease domain-containing protein [Bacteroidota bacterium]
MKRTDKQFIEDIMDCIRTIQYYLRDCSLNDLQNDRMRKDAIIRNYQVIGEAASRVTEITKKKYPEINWREMKSMRNFLIHQYSEITTKTLFETSQNVLPNQLELLKNIDLNTI